MKKTTSKTTSVKAKKIEPGSYVFLEQLFDTITARKKAKAEKSYIANLFAKGSSHIAKKFGEEAVETIIAAESGKKKDIIYESADALFHLLVLWAAKDISPGMVIEELQRREGISGIDEKKSRK